MEQSRADVAENLRKSLKVSQIFYNLYCRFGALDAETHGVCKISPLSKNPDEADFPDTMQTRDRHGGHCSKASKTPDPVEIDLLDLPEIWWSQASVALSCRGEMAAFSWWSSTETQCWGIRGMRRAQPVKTPPRSRAGLLQTPLCGVSKSRLLRTVTPKDC